MLIGLQGKMGSGKTLSMSILGLFLSKELQVPLLANYSLKNARIISELRELWEMDSAIFCADELHVSMDSRGWKNNTQITHFITQTRKKNIIFMYTTQHIGQVDLRVRQNTDILINCEKKTSGHWLQFIDWIYQTLGRKYQITPDTARKFYGVYNTNEIVKPLKN